MDSTSYNFFRTHGYLELGKVFTDAEVAGALQILEQDAQSYGYNWQNLQNGQSANCDVLVTAPELDGVIRHPAILPTIQHLFGGPICFSEISLRTMYSYDRANQIWHRDRPHLIEHPLRMAYLQLMIYLTDVNEDTHCFSLSPESVDDPILENDRQVAERGCTHLYGPAGTAVLFNVSCLHTATYRPTPDMRKSIQIYYGHSDGPFISNDSLVPPLFWRDHPDEQTRAFYGVLNDRTKLMDRAFNCEH